ncbi:aminotransferase class I/II-fold pyridoxal phosphate-dependent enzyme, partial [Xanthomonas euvesicatoria]|uniref:aminotransferase class I/II-fold pyridoxal phosphate-dependent enzyme n=1 Tax=Xanthomonas euvesicatoria TaxID=456327 RepID=UPI000F8F2003
LGVEVSYVSQTDLQEWQDAVKSNTKLFFLETPSNPLTEVANLQVLAEIAHKAGALLAVDNTFCSPVLQKPLAWGADLSIESATKLIDGQGRVFGGTVAGNKDLVEKVSAQVKTTGQALSPFNAWILLSGVETLHVRVRQQSANA